MKESDLTAVADLGKHRRPKKELPHTHPIEASPELVILPELNTVCVALEVQGVVGLYHLGVNPCARFLAGAGASAHHRQKALHKRDPTAAVSRDELQPRRVA